MAGQYSFTMHRLNKYYGDRHVLKDIGLCFYPGAKIGVVGNNGSGKSTLLKIMAGLDTDFVGEAFPDKGVRIGMVPQEPKLDPDKTVREYVEGAFARIKGLVQEFEDISMKMGEADPDEMDKLMTRMGVIQDELDACDGWEIDRHVDRAADALVLPPDDARIGTLSGGELRRVALCKVLLEKPDMLLLDEPTNHLDAETVSWLEAQLRDYPGNVIVVTHDRYFLDNVTKWILELEEGRGIPFEGNYSSWLGQKLDILAKRGKGDSWRSASLDKELRWIKMTARERHDLSQARVAHYERMFADAKQIDSKAPVIEIPLGDRLGDEVLTFDHVSKSYDGRTILDDVSFIVPPGAIVGVVGPNGAGKTTLFRLVTGQEEPSGGTITMGATVDLSHVDQMREGLDPTKTVWEEISGGLDDIELGTRKVASRNYVARFNFSGSDQQKLVGDLSGGERNRVYLAKLVKRGGNFILLDEPSNDLDVSALRMLEDAIMAFNGSMMVISHDRFFLDRVCTHLLVFEGDGKVVWFTGNYDDYEKKRAQELGDTYAGRRKRYHTI